MVVRGEARILDWGDMPNSGTGTRPILRIPTINIKMSKNIMQNDAAPRYIELFNALAKVKICQYMF
jgi:hypothetical protein